MEMKYTIRPEWEGVTVTVNTDNKIVTFTIDKDTPDVLLELLAKINHPAVNDNKD